MLLNEISTTHQYNIVTLLSHVRTTGHEYAHDDERIKTLLRTVNKITDGIAALGPANLWPGLLPFVPRLAKALQGVKDDIKTIVHTMEVRKHAIRLPRSLCFWSVKKKENIVYVPRSSLYILVSRVIKLLRSRVHQSMKIKHMFERFYMIQDPPDTHGLAGSTFTRRTLQGSL
jgi:hypothetical protein